MRGGPGLYVERFPEDLRRRAKAAAALEGEDLRQLVIRAVEREVSQREALAAAKHEHEATLDQPCTWPGCGITRRDHGSPITEPRAGWTHPWQPPEADWYGALEMTQGSGGPVVRRDRR